MALAVSIAYFSLMLGRRFGWSRWQIICLAVAIGLIGAPVLFGILGA